MVDQRMPEVAVWLRSTIEGDKAAAEAIGAGVWTVAKAGRAELDELAILDDGRPIIDSGWEGGGVYDADVAHHIALHDPRDTIARCEAELAELDRHQPNFAGDCTRCDQVAPCEAVVIKARGYRHRPGWKDWEPHTGQERKP
ncbi:DUF6221 family protein [Acrocarpospora sp. B8E8]|uniref:DUF6221 family protein n=1 Tax=Acrocarpospora sp. B8E8 TaxID=3153572 RepID=UPI00325D4070